PAGGSHRGWLSPALGCPKIAFVGRRGTEGSLSTETRLTGPSAGLLAALLRGPASGGGGVGRSGVPLGLRRPLDQTPHHLSGQGRQALGSAVAEHRLSRRRGHRANELIRLVTLGESLDDRSDPGVAHAAQARLPEAH